MSFSSFLSLLAGDPLLFLTALLTLSVMLVNGWTDAPGAIAVCVSTRALPVRAAITLAAVMNFAGAAVIAALSPQVAFTVRDMVDLGRDPRDTAVALVAAMAAIVIWATVAWRYGIPTSESHALLAGLSGAALAVRGSASAISAAAWGRVLWGMCLATLPALALGFCLSRLTAAACRPLDRRRAAGPFRVGQIAAACGAAFMHGAQDGQKFIAVFLLALSCGQGREAAQFAVPGWLSLLCAGVIAAGTAMGGERIMKAMGEDMVRLEPYQGLCADASSVLTLLLCTLWGMPASTSHAKTAAMLGAGAAARCRAVNWGVALDMCRAWVLTFPVCGGMGYAAAWALGFITK